MGDDRKKKIAIVSVCSLVLIAMVVALTIGIRGHDDAPARDIPTSQKAIATICQSTDYKEACVDTLKSSNTTDPKELIKLAFEAAKKYINEAAENSTMIRDLQKDPRAKAALENCKELAGRAINDLERSCLKFSNLDLSNWDGMLEDLKIWLSGAITYQETCLDGFEGISGDAGEQMRQLLTKSMQLTSNGLAMVTEISSFLDAMGPSILPSKRRLLSEDLPVLGHGDDFPDWLDVQGKRRLLSQDLPVLGHGDDFPDWLDVQGKRRLLSEDLPVLGHGDDFPDWLDVQGRRLLSQRHQHLTPHLTVAKDGSGNFTTINEALKHVPTNRNIRFILYVKAGVYEEKINIDSSITQLMMIGDGPTKTKITGSLNFIDGIATYHTATVAVAGDGFMAKNIGFENSAGPGKHQAVALRVSADRAIFYKCQMDGYQDTLYAHTYRQFYKDCTISGTIDFIFGDSAAVFQGCTLIVRKPLDNQKNIVTAQGRKDIRQPTGIVLQNCTLKADPEYYPFRNKLTSYLGRPWKEFSRTVIMESFIDDLIHPDGWLPWNETFALKTLFYTEFNNRGPGSSKEGRVKWTGIRDLPAERVERFTVENFIHGKEWIQKKRVPYDPGFVFPLPKEDSNKAYSPTTPAEIKDLGAAKDKSGYQYKSDPAPADKADNKKHKHKHKQDKPDEETLIDSPVDAPTLAPTIAPIAAPTLAPTISPIAAPTLAPTISPIAGIPFAPASSPSAGLAPASSPLGSSTPVAPSYIAAPPVTGAAPALSPQPAQPMDKQSLMKLFFRG